MRFLILSILTTLISLPAHAELGVHAGAHIEFGSMGTATTDIYESRSMGAFGFQLMPGYRTMGKALLIGLMANLRFHSQLSGGTSMEYSGQSFLLGPAVALDLAKLKILVGWDIRARHSAKQNTSFSGSGLRFLLGYRIMGNMTADLQLLTTKYKTRSIDSVQADIGENPVKSTMVGLGLSFAY